MYTNPAILHQVRAREIEERRLDELEDEMFLRELDQIDLLFETTDDQLINLYMEIEALLS